MKRTNIIALFLCMAGLASCSKEEAATVSVPAGTSTAIVPTAGLSMCATSRVALPGGPVSGTTFPSDTEDLFAVTAYKGTAAPTDDYSNAYFVNQTVDSDADGTLSFRNDQYYPADAEKLYFYAYSPVSTTGFTAGTASAVPTVAWTINGTQDIMYANVVSGIGKVSTGTTQLQPSFTFKHLLKQVRFKLVRGEGFEEGINASSVKITNCRTQASLNLITGDLTFTGDADQSIGLSGTYPILQSGSEEIGSLLCEAGETSLNIEILAAGITYKATVTLDSTSEDITAGGAGVSHLVTLTFIGTQIVPSASITDWVDVGETSGTIE